MSARCQVLRVKTSWLTPACLQSLIHPALMQWGNRHLYDGVTAVHEPCGHELRLEASCPECDAPVPGREVRMKYRRREAARAVGLE